MNKPTGVIVFGILQIVFSLIGLLILGRSLMGIISFYSLLGISFWSPISSDIVTNIGYIFLLIIFAGGLTAGISVLMLKSWARKLSIVHALALMVLMLSLFLLRFFSSGGSDQGIIYTYVFVVFLLPALIYACLIIWYFNRRAIRARFL